MGRHRRRRPRSGNSPASTTRGTPASSGGSHGATAGPLATADAVRPPTGLAGLVSWWNQQQATAPPGEGGDLERSGDRDDVPARVRTGTLDDAVGQGDVFDPGTIDPLVTFRDALEQVLLDEAWADGVEVR